MLDVSTTCVEANFRVKLYISCRVNVYRMRKVLDNDLGQFAVS